MNYCKKCVQPSTRPNIYFNEDGICGACLWEEEKKKIDWEDRKRELGDISQWARSQHAPYDCVIGVSGGKDSTFQALYMRDVMGLRPLLVCSEPYENTEIGLKNLQNLKNSGFDAITLKANKHVLKKLFKKDFIKIGNPNRASEYCLYSSVFIIADKFDIPLIVNGENPGQTLGIGNLKSANGDAANIWKHNTVKRNVFDIYADDADAAELFMLHADMEAILKKGIKDVWLSNYVKEWGQLHNAKFSIAHGLTIYPDTFDPYAKGQYRRFSSLDHAFREVNQMLKYIKYGFGFTTDQACYDIRDGEISREEAIYLVKELDGKCAREHILSFCKMIDITENQFWDIAESFRGGMWVQNNGSWKLDNPIWEQIPVMQDFTVDSIMKRLKI